MVCAAILSFVNNEELFDEGQLIDKTGYLLFKSLFILPEKSKSSQSLIGDCLSVVFSKSLKDRWNNFSR